DLPSFPTRRSSDLRRSASGWIPRSLASIAEVPSQLSHSGPLGLGWRESAPGFGRLPVAVQLRVSLDAGATHGAGRNYAATILATILVQYAAELADRREARCGVARNAHPCRTPVTHSLRQHRPKLTRALSSRLNGPVRSP